MKNYDKLTELIVKNKITKLTLFPLCLICCFCLVCTHKSCSCFLSLPNLQILLQLLKILFVQQTLSVRSIKSRKLFLAYRIRLTKKALKAVCKVFHLVALVRHSDGCHCLLSISSRDISNVFTKSDR